MFLIIAIIGGLMIFGCLSYASSVVRYNVKTISDYQREQFGNEIEAVNRSKGVKYHE